MKMCAYVFGKIIFEVNFIHQNDVMVSKKLLIKYANTFQFTEHLYFYIVSQTNKENKMLQYINISGTNRHILNIIFDYIIILI